MSEKQQHTTANLRKKMLSRYGSEPSLHKHNKLHHTHRAHCKTHGIQITSNETLAQEENKPTGLRRKTNLQKICKRLAKRSFH